MGSNPKRLEPSSTLLCESKHHIIYCSFHMQNLTTWWPAFCRHQKRTGMRVCSCYKAASRLLVLVIVLVIVLVLVLVLVLLLTCKGCLHYSCYREAWTRKDRMASDDEVLITSASFTVMRSLLKTKSRRKRRWWMTSVFRSRNRYS
jgi:hypothetical protein